MRSRPSSYYTPAQRTTRTTHHIHHYHYGHSYDWYHSQPHYYVGGGYSSAFWWMMMEWSAERRARWLYHNQHSIEQSAYERGMRDAAVAAEMAKLKSQSVAVNADYIDPEFTENPDLMYTQDYVEAAYNPTVVPASGGGMVVVYVFLFLLVGGIVVYFVFVKRWGH